jgi:[phosphatase 2A protein]-leucine-carboxy methyltransferase
MDLLDTSSVGSKFLSHSCESPTMEEPGVCTASNASNHEALVMGTAQDAVKAKCAAVAAGYYRDPYIAKFATQAAQQPVQVIIKRGTFARAACVFKAVATFLRENDSAQVIVLGSGKDTLFFQVVDEFTSSRSSESCLRWFEVDYGVILKEKTSVLKMNPELFSSTIVNTEMDGICEVKPLGHKTWPRDTTCHFIAHDLQHDPHTLVHTRLIQQVGMNPALPTLLIMECVQMYLPVPSVTGLFTELTTAIQDCTMVGFEPILGDTSSNDAFGRMMQENLTKAGVVRADSCLVQTRTLSQMIAQLRTAGFVRATACDMYAAYETVLSPAQRALAQKCEFLDELEEFILIMRHYCFVVATNSETSASGQSMYAVGKTSSATSMGFVTGKCEELL